MSNEERFKKIKGVYYNTYYWDMGGGIKGLWHRVIRRIGKPLGERICARQTDCNEALLQLAEAQQAEIDSLRSELAAQKTEVNLLKKQMLRMIVQK